MQLSESKANNATGSRRKAVGHVLHEREGALRQRRLGALGTVDAVGISESEPEEEEAEEKAKEKE